MTHRFIHCLKSGVPLNENSIKTDKNQLVALVTGAARGIGKAVADELRERGVTVIGTSRLGNSSPIQEHTPAGPDPVQLDVRNEAQVLETFKYVTKVYGRIDILVNNSGVGTFCPITETSLEAFKEMIDTNLTGAFLCSREAMKLMKARAGGRIINIGSIADHSALSGNGGYSASKFGLRGLNGVINEEGKLSQIRATLVSLGATYTEIWKSRPEFSEKDMLSVSEVAQLISDIAVKPLSMRIDEVRLSPSKGIL